VAHPPLYTVYSFLAVSRVGSKFPRHLWSPEQWTGVERRPFPLFPHTPNPTCLTHVLLSLPAIYRGKSILTESYQIFFFFVIFFIYPQQNYQRGSDFHPLFILVRIVSHPVNAVEFNCTCEFYTLACYCDWGLFMIVNKLLISRVFKNLIGHV